MHAPQTTIGIFAILLLLGIAAPEVSFAQGRDARELRARADELRERTLQRETREERPARLQFQQHTETKTSSASELTEKVQSLQEAQETHRQNPNNIAAQKAVLLRTIESLQEYMRLLRAKTAQLPVITRRHRGFYTR